MLVAGDVVAGPGVAYEVPWMARGERMEPSYGFHGAVKRPICKQRSASEDACCGSTFQPKAPRNGLSGGRCIGQETSRLELKSTC